MSRFCLPLLALLALPAAPAFAQDHEDREWRVRGEYLMPQQGSLLAGTREIDVATLNLYRDWRLVPGVTLSATAGVAHASGERRDPGQPALKSDATGVSAGGALRLAPVKLGPVTPFAEGSIEFLYTFGTPFPAGGTSVNGFVRWGAGASIAVSPRLSVEAGWHGAHISNGGKDGSYNPGWDGRGPFLGVSFRR